jgi:hypothetical protein
MSFLTWPFNVSFLSISPYHPSVGTYIQLQAHWNHCLLNKPYLFLSQCLCICCSICLECFVFIPLLGFLLHFFQVSTQMLPSSEKHSLTTLSKITVFLCLLKFPSHSLTLLNLVYYYMLNFFAYFLSAFPSRKVSTWCQGCWVSSLALYFPYLAHTRYIINNWLRNEYIYMISFTLKKTMCAWMWVHMGSKINTINTSCLWEESRNKRIVHFALHISALFCLRKERQNWLQHDRRKKLNIFSNINLVIKFRNSY